MFKKKTISPIIVLLCMFFSIRLLAQDISDINLADMSLEELMNVRITTASKSSQKTSEAPATIFVITHEQIKTRGYINLEEALEDIPGIEIQRKAITETSDYYSFRGISGNDKFIVLLDGIRVSSIVGTPHTISNNYSIANAKRIEVILGPASALYGADAFSGIVNIITYDGGESNDIDVSSYYGTYNTYDENIRIGGLLKDIKFSVNGKYYHSDEPNFSKIYKKEYSWFNNEYQNNGQVRLAPQPALENIIVNAPLVDYETPTDAYFIHAKLNIKNLEFGFMNNSESHSTSVGGRPEYNIYSKDSKYDVAITSFYLRHNYTSENKKFGIESVISYGKHELKPSSKFINTFTSYKDGYKFGDENITKIEEQLSWNIKENCSLIGGASFEDINSLPKTGDLPFQYDANKAADLQSLYYLGTNITDQFGRDLTIYQDFYNINYQNYGSYVQFQGMFANIFGVTIGTRLDYNTRYASTINPRIGLTIKATEKINFKLLYGQAYLAPSPYTAYQHYGSFIPTSDAGGITGLVGPFWHLPNPNLEPEKLNSYEFGLNYSPTNNIVLSSNAYYNLIKELIVVEDFIGETFKGIPIDFVERPVNKGKANTYGFTLRADYRLNLGKSSINSNIAYIYSDGDIDGKPLPYSAKNTIKAEVGWSSKKLDVSVRLINRSSSLNGIQVDANGNPSKVDGFTLINLNISCKVFATEKYNGAINLKILNLTNVKYYNPTVGTGELFTGSPQDPMRINLGVVFGF